MEFRIVFALLVVTSATAEELEPTIYDLRVDLAEVVEVGEVRPVDGVTSSAQPDEAALRVFRDNGYAAVIDLRAPDENRGFDERAAVEGLGMDYVALPIAGEQSISFDNARKLDELIESYTGPVLIHCASSNRVGALMALRQSLEGASDDIAMAVGWQAGLTSLEPVVLERLAERQAVNGAQQRE